MAGEVISRLAVVVVTVVVRVNPWSVGLLVVVSSHTSGCSDHNESVIRPSFDPAGTHQTHKKHKIALNDWTTEALSLSQRLDLFPHLRRFLFELAYPPQSVFPEQLDLDL